MQPKITRFLDISRDCREKVIVNVGQHLNLFITNYAIESFDIKLDVTVKEDAVFNVYIYSVSHNSFRQVDVQIIQSSNSTSNAVFKIFNFNNAYTNIMIKAIAKKNTHGIIANQDVCAILFSDQSKVNVTPAMLIDTNAIKASHAVNVGKIDPEQLFFLMSRGLSEPEATILILKGLFGQLNDTAEKQGTDLYNKLVGRLEEIIRNES